MKSPVLKNGRGRKQRDQQPAGCGPFAAVSGGASRRAAPIKYSGGRRGRSAALPCAGRAGAAGRSPLEAGGGGGRGTAALAVLAPADGRRAFSELQSLETSQGGAGRQGPGSRAEGRGRGGRGGVGVWPRLARWVCPLWECLLGRKVQPSQSGLQVFLHA